MSGGKMQIGGQHGKEGSLTTRGFNAYEGLLMLHLMSSLEKCLFTSSAHLKKNQFVCLYGAVIT